MADGWRGGGCSSCSNCSTDAVVEAAVGSSRRKLAGEEGPSTQAPESSGTRSSSSSQSWPTGGGGGGWVRHIFAVSPLKKPVHDLVIHLSSEESQRGETWVPVVAQGTVQH